MAYVLKVENKVSYLHVKATGENTPENVANYMTDVRNTCIENKCPFVLIEENLNGPSLGTSAIFNIVTKASEQVGHSVRQIAYIDVNPQHDMALMQFAETTAVNRGINIRVFPTVQEAEQWMREEKM
jgi:hypothetical protein